MAISVRDSISIITVYINKETRLQNPRKFQSPYCSTNKHSSIILFPYNTKYQKTIINTSAMQRLATIN